MKLRNFILMQLMAFTIFTAGFYSAISSADSTFPKIKDINPYVYQLALKAYSAALQEGIDDPNQILTIIDYSLPSDVPRLWVVDMTNNKVLFETLVAHGKGSGETSATFFSDKNGTLATSLGLFLTENTYEGKHGLSLRLKGLEKSFNDRAESRSIVMHSAWYVNKQFAKEHHRIGRSWGCPALDPKISTPLINTIKNGTLVFAYGPDQRWLDNSEFLNSSKG